VSGLITQSSVLIVVIKRPSSPIPAFHQCEARSFRNHKALPFLRMLLITTTDLKARSGCVVQGYLLDQNKVDFAQISAPTMPIRRMA
jgi:hypothetical protein